jgi:hypothetical protein
MSTKMLCNLSGSILIVVLISRCVSQNAQQNTPQYPRSFENNQQNTTQNPGINIDDKTAQQRLIPPQMWFNPSQMQNIKPGAGVEQIRKMIQDQQKRVQEQQKRDMIRTLEVDERQWSIIEPKLKKVQEYKELAAINIGSSVNSVANNDSSSQFQSFSGGFSFQSGNSGRQFVTSNIDPPSPQMAQGLKICQQLNELLENPASEIRAINLKIAELRRFREQARKQLEQAKRELSDVLNERQKSKLVLLGLLD